MSEQATMEPRRHEMATMGGEGDVKLIWDPAKPDEVEVAKNTFDKLLGKGYKAFLVKKKGEQGEEVKTFDASYEKLIMVPRMVGG